MRLAFLLPGAILAMALGATAAAAQSDDGGASYAAASQRLLEKGREALSAEKYRDALSYFESALVADPGSVKALVAIGRAHEALDQKDAGLAYYGRALELAPNNRRALERESLALLDQGELEKAETNLDRLEMVCKERDSCPERETVAEAIEAYKAEHPSVAAAEQDSGETDGDSGGHDSDER